jgi:hypothetical protein
MSTGILTSPEPRTWAPAALSLAEAGRRYLADRDWHTRIVGPLLLLALRRGLVGVLMSAARGGAVAAELRGLGLVYPVLPGLGARPTWVFIARSGPCDYRLCSHFYADVLRNTWIPLPPSKIEGRSLEWITAPDGRQPRIPELGPLMGVIHGGDDYPIRTWRPTPWRPGRKASSRHLLEELYLGERQVRPADGVVQRNDVDLDAGRALAAGQAMDLLVGGVDQGQVGGLAG